MAVEQSPTSGSIPASGLVLPGGHGATEYLTFEEFVCRCPLSASTIRRRIKDGSIPHVQPGGKGHRMLIPENVLDSLCLAGQLGPVGQENCAVSAQEIRAGSDVAASPPESAKEPRLPGPAPKWKNQMKFGR